jgi:hypothetical protein
METLRLELPGGQDPETTFQAAVAVLLEALGLDLEKAVAPHPAHYLPRTAGGRFLKASQVVHGPRLTEAECAAARAEAHRLQAEELTPRLFRHLADFQAGHFAAQEWYDRTAADLRYFYGELYRYGKRAAGNPGLVLGPQDKALLQRLVEDELHYLAGFREHLHSGGGKMPYPQRLQLYANAAWEAFWTGWVLGDTRPGRQVRWRYGATEHHCGLAAGGKARGCSDFVQLGWLEATAFVSQVLMKGFAPRSGMLECTGTHCLCWLEERLVGAGETAEGTETWPQGPPYAGAAGMSHDAVAESGVTPTPAVAPTTEPTAEQAAAARAEAGAPHYLTEDELRAYGDPGKVPTQGTGETPEGASGTLTADPALLPLLAALAFLGSRRQAVLRDAVSFLFLNARARGAHLTSAAALGRLVALRDRKERWLQARHALTEAQAEEVFRQASAAEAFRVHGRFVTWTLRGWPEPQENAYPDLREFFRSLPE